jgi:predicted Fe-Mo cluster-binding NifX family protein
MGWRVAAASIDGILVTEHYGRSKWFYIVDIQPDGTFINVERRSVTPLCESGSHSESGMASGIQALKDCTAVLVAVIGPSAKKQLELAGISVFEQPVIIEEAAKKLAAYYGKINQPESSQLNNR